MPRERREAAAVISTPWGTLGDLAAAAFALAVLSGAALVPAYDSGDGYASIAALLLANPGGTFFRNVHYWAGQLCLILTLLHVWEHLRASTEGRVSKGLWLRLTMTLPLVAFIMLSGFVLRADSDARQALRILSEATAQVPAVGPLLATLFFGAADRLDVVYVQHAATATIAVWLFVIEHARRGFWPHPPAVVAVTILASGLSLFLSPGLHDGLTPAVKGPWYFLGLQEILHWTPWPLLVVAAGAGLVSLFYALRVMPAAGAAWVKRGLLALLVIYAGLCGVGAFLRGENWAWAPSWPSGGGNLRTGWLLAATPDAPAVLPAPLPTVMGRPEGCVVCHAEVKGLGSSHRPDAVGCASCHGGDVFTLDSTRAHAGMDLIPGNLASARRRCGLPACHASIVPRIERSVMSTMRGIVEIDRLVFGAPAAPPDVPAHVERLGHTAADTHLRQLCASCHLGGAKTALGPNRESTRGGGCNACHLAYSQEALDALARYEQQKSRGPAAPPRVHPAVSLDISDGQCFGCHSRSGRIATNYEGWHEVYETSAGATVPASPFPSRLRALEDGRVFEREMPDIHQQRGLDCIDCHTAVEVMGDGVAHARKAAQIRVTCADCHTAPGTKVPPVTTETVDPESRRILAVRAWPGPAANRYLRVASGETLVNVVLEETGTPVLIRKRTGERRPLKPQAPVCLEGRGHARLTCGSCHNAWAPRCPTCHTSFDRAAEAYDWVDDADVKGAWKERAGPFAALAPTLGVRRILDASSAPHEVIETFAPGMILDIDRNREPGKPSDIVFRRLYARVEPHTTRREARPCESCHNDPVALGYGQGVLRYDVVEGRGRWFFRSASPPAPNDGLPADAWTPFLGTRTGMLSTRDDVRPFSVEEQRKILRVGACLTCHAVASPAMRDSVRDFDAVLARRSRRCVLPSWN